jgi:hypothetical protein
VKKLLILFLIPFYFFIGCSKSTKGHSPVKILNQFYDALSKRDGEKVYQLISSSSLNQVISDIHTYLLTLLEIDPQNIEVKKLLMYQGKKLMTEFINNSHIFKVKKKVVTVSEINFSNQNMNCLVSARIDDKIEKILLIKEKGNWKLSIRNLNL